MARRRRRPTRHGKRVLTEKVAAPPDPVPDPGPAPTNLGEDVLRHLGIPGILVVLVLLSLLAVAVVRDQLVAPVLTYREEGRPVTVKAEEGCLVYRRDLGGRRTDTVTRQCAATRPEGLGRWAPQTRETYGVDPSGQHVTELVAFGLVPDAVARVRYTLPGGHTVDVDTRHHDGLDHPAFWTHLTSISLPLDLRETDGDAVFTRFQMFDAAGQEVPGV